MKRFSIWAAQHNLSPLKASVPKILNFILYLKHPGHSVLSKSTWMQSRHTTIKSCSVFSHPPGSRFLKVLLHSYRSTECPLRWDLNDILTNHMEPLFEPLSKCSLYHLTLKTAFLVTIISARRVSELQGLMANPPYTALHGNKIWLAKNNLLGRCLFIFIRISISVFESSLKFLFFSPMLSFKVFPLLFCCVKDPHKQGNLDYG